MSFKNYLNVYEFETQLPGSGEVIKFKPLTTGDLKKLLIYENETDEVVIENALDDLIQSSVITENFDIKNCYLQDRFFLLVEIRKKSKGEVHRFNTICQKCGSQILSVIDLNDLKVTHPQKMEEEIVLNENISVNIGHITRIEQMNAFKFLDKKGSKLQKTTNMSILTHAAGIKSITTPDGKEDDINISDKVFLLENIPTNSYEKIRDWFDDNTFGIDFSYTTECVNCGNKKEMTIPLDNFFF